jgi:hypothetical protein
MEPENWVAVIAAAIGSAGLSGFVTGAVQVGRVSRAARTVEQLMKAAPETATGSGAAAAKEAINRARLRLAAIVLVKHGRSTKAVLGLALLAGAAGSGYMVYGAIQGTFGASQMWGVVAGLVAYVILMATLADLTLQVQRAWFIMVAERPDANIPDTVAMVTGGVSLKGRFRDTKPGAKG